MKNFFLAMCLIAAPMFVLSSCSSDDDDNLAKAVAGTYNCSLIITGDDVDESQAETGVPLPATIILTRESDDKVKLELDNFMGGLVKGVQVSGATLSGKEKDVTLRYDGVIPSVNVGTEEFKKVEIEIKATIKDKKNMSIYIDVDVIGGIMVNGSGTKK